MPPETLIFTAVHGNEGFSIPIVRGLSKQFDFEWIIANPRALEKNSRFLESDLNRSGPGNPDSNLYEQRLAFRLIKKGCEYQQVIDIHGTNANTGLFIIICDPNWQNIELAKKFDITNVVLWPGLLPTGPLCQFIPNSLEIECGPKSSFSTSQELNRVISVFLNKQSPTVNQNYFIVTGRLTGQQPNNLKDFQETIIDNNTFYPLLSYQYPNITCYIMQKLNNDQMI